MPSMPLVEALFSDRDAVGSQMAVRASAGLEDELAIAMSCEALARSLLNAWAEEPDKKVRPAADSMEDG